MSKYYTKYIAFTFFMAILWGCQSNRLVTKDNFSNVYSFLDVGVRPEYVIYHESKESTKLYFKIPTSSLLYTRADKQSPFSSRVEIKYILRNSYDDPSITDSSSVYFEDINDQKKDKELIGNIDIKIPSGKNYVLEMVCTDLNRKRAHTIYLNIDKSNPYGRQNFLCLKEGSDIPLFKNYVDAEQRVFVKSNDPSKKLFCLYFNKKFDLPPPPFVNRGWGQINIDRDSLFFLNATDEGKQYLDVPEKGFVHLVMDTAQMEGYSLYKFAQDYPNTTSAEGLIKPLRYLCSRREYQKLDEAVDKKIALDEYWLNILSDKDKARELIKKFYSRVEICNDLFTSFVEGWKTDRGLIHIVFGAPNVVYKSNNAETWVYGEEHNIMAMTFTFFKTDNPFSDNDFRLERNLSYKTNWYRAIEGWRNGRLYSSN